MGPRRVRDNAAATTASPFTGTSTIQYQHDWNQTEIATAKEMLACEVNNAKHGTADRVGWLVAAINSARAWNGQSVKHMVRNKIKGSR